MMVGLKSWVDDNSSPNSPLRDHNLLDDRNQCVRLIDPAQWIGNLNTELRHQLRV